MRKELAVFIFVLGALAFNWPFFNIFEESLPAYLFSAWFLFIVAQMFQGRRLRGDETRKRRKEFLWRRRPG